MLAILADTGFTLVVVANALRLLRGAGIQRMRLTKGLISECSSLGNVAKRNLAKQLATPERRGAMRKHSRSCRAFVIGGVLSVFIFALALAVSPQLHERIHKAAALSQHECAVTIIASGKYEQNDAPTLVSGSQPAVRFSKIPALNSVWVAAPFLGASVFEHAPPASV